MVPRAASLLGRYLWQAACGSTAALPAEQALQRVHLGASYGAAQLLARLFDYGHRHYASRAGKRKAAAQSASEESPSEAEMENMQPNATKTRSTAPAIDPAKAEQLQAVLAHINKKYGKGSILRHDSSTCMETISSGCIALDVALGGGYPKGRIIEIYGPESSGKTTLALHAIAEVQRQGGTACLIDVEHAFEPGYAQALGLDLGSLLHSQPSSGEEALQIADELVRSGVVDLVVIDSVAALVPRAELEGDMGVQLVGLQARLMSQGLRKLTGNTSRSSATIIFLNQIRHKVGVMFGSPEITAGGNALKYYASARVELRRREVLGERGIKVKAKVVKNKCAPPFRVVEFDILFASGIDNMGSLLEAAEASGVVTRKGAWFYFGEARLGQGREGCVQVLQTDADVRQQLEEAVRGTMKESGKVLPKPSEEGHHSGAEDEEHLQQEMHSA